MRFFATALALGPPLTGRLPLAAAGVGLALLATALNWWRLVHDGGRAARGAVRLELRWFRPWTALRWLVGAGAVVAALAGWPPAVVLVLVSLVAAAKRRDTQDATGVLSHETRKRDTALDVATLTDAPTGKEIERIADAERKGTSVEPVKTEMNMAEATTSNNRPVAGGTSV